MKCPLGRFALSCLGSTEMTGCELLENGLPIAITNQPGAVVIAYKKSR